MTEERLGNECCWPPACCWGHSRDEVGQETQETQLCCHLDFSDSRWTANLLSCKVRGRELVLRGGLMWPNQLQTCSKGGLELQTLLLSTSQVLRL